MKSHSMFTKVLGVTAVMALPLIGLGQRTDESVRIKVHKTQEGHTLQVEEDVPASDAQDLQQLMNKYGMSDELKELKPGEEVEIVIRRKQAGDESSDVTIEMDRKPDPTTPVPSPTPAPTPAPKPVERKPAFLGVHYEMEVGTNTGSHITKVEPSTPASRAGLKEGDILTHADGVALDELEDLADIISKKYAGDKVKIAYIRDGKPASTWVILTERDENFFKNYSGPTYRVEKYWEDQPGSRIWIEDGNVKTNEADNGGPLLGVVMLHKEQRTVVNGVETVTKTDGALVEEVIDGSPAAEIGMRKGDKITFVNGTHITKADEVTSLISKMKPGDKVTVEFIRGTTRMSGSGTLKDRSGFTLPDLGAREEEYIRLRGDGSDSMLDRMHEMMDEAKARSSGNPTTVREFRMVIKMDELTPVEAQSLSARTGKSIKPQSDLDLRGLSLSPNPSTGRFNLNFELPTKGTTSIDVMDMNGNFVYSEQLNGFSGRYTRDFDISQEAKGVYVLRIVQNGKAFTRKIVTQ